MRQSLRLHPDSICSAATRIEVEVAQPRPGSLLFAYAVTGKIRDLRLPPAMAARRADALWRHTCFEAFVRPSSGDAYYEFNFAPTKQWAAYRFNGYRGEMRVAAEISAPRIDVQSAPERYVLQAALDLSSLPRDAGYRLGLSAVIEETGGRLSYWALAHPPGKPDFHHADCFALEF